MALWRGTGNRPMPPVDEEGRIDINSPKYQEYLDELDIEDMMNFARRHESRGRGSQLLLFVIVVLMAVFAWCYFFWG